MVSIGNEIVTVDTPKALNYLGVSPKFSPVTMVTCRQFGDPLQHEPRMASTTLAQLMEIEKTADPQDFASYLPGASQFCPNGVHYPFWRDCSLAKPSLFLTPTALLLQMILALQGKMVYSSCWSY